MLQFVMNDRPCNMHKLDFAEVHGRTISFSFSREFCDYKITRIVKMLFSSLK